MSSSGHEQPVYVLVNFQTEIDILAAKNKSPRQAAGAIICKTLITVP
jgi:hypothetical protein